MSGRIILRFFRSCMLGVAILLAVPAAAQTADDAAQHRILVMMTLAPDHFRPGASYSGGYGDSMARNALRRVARRIARMHALTLVDDWPMPLLHLACFVMTVPADRTVDAAVAQVGTDPAVVWAQPMHVYTTQASAPGDDPLMAAQPATWEWHLAKLHRLATGKGVTVAVIDTRIERDHPDLKGQIAAMQDFVPEHPAGAEQHGTAVAGIIAARAGNGVGIVGVAPEAQLLGLRACWQQPRGATSICTSFSLASALHFAVEHRAEIINMSLTGPPDLLLGKLVALAQARGATVVAAYDGQVPGGGFPASAPGVIAVTDVALAGLEPSVYVAPGRDVLTTQPGGRWYLVNGSSFAAAHVSGLVALLRQWSGDSRAPIRLARSGARVDAYASLVAVASRCDRRCPADRAVVASAHR